MSGLSILWLVLVIPATVAEVIGLNLRKPGVDGYLPVQIFVGFVYLAAFLSCKSPSTDPNSYGAAG